jgi:hypothetical protein
MNINRNSDFLRIHQSLTGFKLIAHGGYYEKEIANFTTPEGRAKYLAGYEAMFSL